MGPDSETEWAKLTLVHARHSRRVPIAGPIEAFPYLDRNVFGDRWRCSITRLVPICLMHGERRGGIEGMVSVSTDLAEDALPPVLLRLHRKLHED